MKFEYEIKGIVLDEYDMQRIKEYYEQRCTAEYLAENYDINEKLAMELAYLVRRKMNKYDYTEEEAIREVLIEAEIKTDDEDWYDYDHRTDEKPWDYGKHFN